MVTMIRILFKEIQRKIFMEEYFQSVEQRYIPVVRLYKGEIIHLWDQPVMLKNFH